ncbi:MAG: hypothetical protein ACREJ2_06300, partial [Planctomycetota bacterium]
MPSPPQPLLRTLCYAAALGTLLALCAPSRSLAAADAEPPLTLAQVKVLPAAGLTAQEIAAIITRRGVAFDADAAAMAALQQAGLSDLDLKAVTAAAQKRQPALQPFTVNNLINMKGIGMSDSEVAASVKKHGIAFAPDDDALNALKRAGCGDDLLAVIRACAVPGSAGAATPATPATPAAPAGGKNRMQDDGLDPDAPNPASATEAPPPGAAPAPAQQLIPAPAPVAPA